MNRWHKGMTSIAGTSGKKAPKQGIKDINNLGISGLFGGKANINDPMATDNEAEETPLQEVQDNIQPKGSGLLRKETSPIR